MVLVSLALSFPGIPLHTQNAVLPLDRAQLLFGVHNEKCNSTLNYVILCAKSFIWKAKFTTKDLSLINFQTYLFHKLTDIKNAYLFMGKEYRFDSWNNIYVLLSRLPGCDNNHEAIMPTQDQEETPIAAEQQDTV